MSSNLSIVADAISAKYAELAKAHEEAVKKANTDIDKAKADRRTAEEAMQDAVASGDMGAYKDAALGRDFADATMAAAKSKLAILEQHGIMPADEYNQLYNETKTAAESCYMDLVNTILPLVERANTAIQTYKANHARLAALLNHIYTTYTDKQDIPYAYATLRIYELPNSKAFDVIKEANVKMLRAWADNNQ